MASPEMVGRALVSHARRSPALFADLFTANTGRPCQPHELHRLIQRFIFACYRAKVKCLIQAPPEHGKTTIIIPSLIWLLHTDLSMKVGLVSSDNDQSSESLTKIRKGLLTKLCAATFPEIRPDYKASASGSKGEWSKVKLYLEDQTQPAFEVFPLMGSVEGHRLDLIWLDDCVTRQCLYSEALRKQTASAIFDSFDKRLRDDGILIVTNNCWHREDAIHEMKHKAEEGKGYAVLWIGYEDDAERIDWRVINPPKTWTLPGNGSLPLWDAVWPRKRLIETRDGPGTSWRRLFGGKAITPEDCRFPPSDKWARWRWSELSKTAKIVGFLDPAGGRRANKGDFGAVVLCLRRSDGTHDVIDCWVDRKPPEFQIAAGFDLHEKWKRLGYGGVFSFEVEMLPKEELWVRQNFEAHQETLRKSGRIWDLPWNVRYPQEPKEARIERIGPPITHGWLRFPENLEELVRTNAHWRNLVTQLEEWPFSDHDDGPDALAGALATGKHPGGTHAEDVFEGMGVF